MTLFKNDLFLQQKFKGGKRNTGKLKYQKFFNKYNHDSSTN